MFFETIFKFLMSAVRSPLVHAIVARVLHSDTRIACTLPVALAARAHFLVAPAPARKSIAHSGEIKRLNVALGSAVNPVNRAGKTLARAAIRVAYVGAPLTPTGYAVVGSAVAVVALVALATTLSGGNRLVAPPRLGWKLS
jgi:hypothetical protein